MIAIRKKTTMALGWLVPALFLLFPMAMALSNVVLLLVLIGFAVTFSRAYLLRDAWSGPAIWLVALFGVVLIGTLYSPTPWYWVSVNLG